MANRDQDQQYGRRGQRGDYQSREERYSGADDDGYGRSATDEGDSAARAGSWDEGRYSQGRDSQQQGRDWRSGAGRPTGENYRGYGDFGQGDYSGSGQRSQYGANTGQNRYGQSGYGQGGYGQQGGNYGRGGQSNYDRPRFGEEQGSSGTSQYGRSNFGSGREPQDFGHQRGDQSFYAGYGGAGGYGSQQGQDRYSSGTFGTERGWREPFGEGQQYGGGEQYGGGRESYGQGGQQQRRGQHWGKGPKGYQRSDERLKEMLCERLREDHDIDASDVTVQVSGGKVTLDGSVDSRQTKNAIEDVAEQLGVHDVQNNLRVSRQSTLGQSTAQGTSGQSTLGQSTSGEASKQRHN